MENVSIKVYIMRKVFKLFLTSFFLFCLCNGLFGQSKNTQDTSPAPYEEDEIPQGLKDLRRFEIITLGSMPFVTLDAAIVYNGYKYASGKSDKFNPLATANYSPDEMKRIIITSLCVSAGIGLSDYIVRLIKRKSSQKKEKEEKSSISIEENPRAVKIPLPEESSGEEN